jgi:hypothetical protein
MTLWKAALSFSAHRRGQPGRLLRRRGEIFQVTGQRGRIAASVFWRRIAFSRLLFSRALETACPKITTGPQPARRFTTAISRWAAAWFPSPAMSCRSITPPAFSPSICSPAKTPVCSMSPTWARRRFPAPMRRGCSKAWFPATSRRWAKGVRATPSSPMSPVAFSTT